MAPSFPDNFREGTEAFLRLETDLVSIKRWWLCGDSVGLEAQTLGDSSRSMQLAGAGMDMYWTC